MANEGSGSGGRSEGRNPGLTARPSPPSTSQSRWTSLLPQLLSPLGPLLALPGMTDSWYVKQDTNGRVIEAEPDSTAILAVSATVFALTLLADLTILLRLLDTHLRFYSFLCLSILVSHALLASIAEALIGSQRDTQAEEGFRLSTAFFMSVAASCAAAIVAILLVVDGIRTQWWSSGGKGISSKQSNLALAFNVFVGMLLIGTVSFKHLLPQNEDTNYLDTLYYVVQITTTVGFGIPTPTSIGGRALTIVFAPLAILSFAVFVAFTSTGVIESIQGKYRESEDKIFGSNETARNAPDRNHLDGSTNEKSLEQLILQLEKENRGQARAQLVVAVAIVATTWTVGAAVFTRLEGWRYGLSFYFCAISMYTIGFGDASPEGDAAKAFFCIWIIASAGSITLLFSILAVRFSSNIKRTLVRGIGGLRRKLCCPSIRKRRNSPRIDSTIPTLSRLSSPSTVRSSTGEKGPSQAVVHAGDVSTRLLNLVRELRSQSRTSLGEEADHVEESSIDDAIRSQMDAEGFDSKTRNIVLSDDNLKQLIYHRILESKFLELERLVTQLLSVSSTPESPPRGHMCRSSPTASP